MSTQTKKRFAFSELWDRHGRILTFQATIEDYQAVGWWDLAWGLLLTWLLNVVAADSFPEFMTFAGEGLRRLVRGGLLGLEYVVLAALLRPRKVSVWRMVPLYNLTGALDLMFFSSAVGSLSAENFSFGQQVFYWITTAWQIIVVAHFLRNGLQICPLPAMVAAILPMLVRTVVQQHISPYVLLPVLLFYLFNIIRVWAPEPPPFKKSGGYLEGKE